MYIPQHFEPPSRDAMRQLMQNYPFAPLITLDGEEFCADHIPFELRKEPGPYGTLVGHVARANPVWQKADGAKALVVFHGPDGYISPSWYALKQETGKVVPTWNFAVVQAYGNIRVIHEAQFIKAHIEKLTDRQESVFAKPWSVGDAPQEFTDMLAKHIVGIEIVISKLVGKWKLSQNRSAADKAGAIKGLREQGNHELANLMDLNFQSPAV